MDDTPSLSASLPTKELQTELTQLRIQLQKAEEKIMLLELALMQSRDFAIGSAAQAGEAIANLQKLSHVQDLLNVHLGIEANTVRMPHKQYRI